MRRGGGGGSLVQESPVVYRNVLGRKSKRIYQNLPHRRAAQDGGIPGWPSRPRTARPTQVGRVQRTFPAIETLFKGIFFIHSWSLCRNSNFG